MAILLKYQCNNYHCQASFEREMEMSTVHCPYCKGTDLTLSNDPPKPPVTPKANYKKIKHEEKKEKIDQLLANAKSEVRRLEKGIDRVLYIIDTEDLSDPVLWQRLQSKLIDLYNGKEIN